MKPAATATDGLLAILGSYGLPVTDLRLRRAADLATALYADRDHWLGISLLEHVLGVLRVLLPFQPDVDTVCACLLQHALKTRKVALPELEEEFGVSVRGLVSSVHLLSHVTMRNRKSSIDDLRLMLLSVSDDVRVLLIILCERTSVLDWLQGSSGVEARRIARDVLGLFAPVAARLGIHTLKQRLEGLAFPTVYGQDAVWVQEQLESLHVRYGDFLDESAKHLMTALREYGIAATVTGREKLPYSIFRKLKSKTFSSIQSLPDLFALRVIVGSEEDCYRVLGLLHRMARPVANRFKDYIAFPKPNGYQSLHTTVTRLPGIPEGLFTEVQVRTQAMHREAEYGIAAHWSYKQGGSAERTLQRVQLQQVLTAQEPMEGSDIPHLADHLFVLTPKGDIVELPEGATPLDFAFQIHTQLGLTFRAARVNGSIVPLDYELENGDVVEVLSHAAPKPSPEWLQLLKMASSRSRLKRYFHAIDRDLYVQRGRAMVNEELKRRRLPALDTDLTLLRTYADRVLTYEEREDLLMKLGQGSDKLLVVLSHAKALPPLSVAAPRRAPSRRAAIGELPVETADGLALPMRFAKCCSPLGGTREDIRGFINRTGQVMVHRATCRMIQSANPERRVTVRWKAA